MRTLVHGAWVIGFDGRDHELLPDGVVVYEDDRILHVGYSFDGHVDRRIEAPGRLISPGLINHHVHAGSNAPHLLFTDPTKTNYLGQNFLAYGAFRPGKQPPPSRPDVERLFGIWGAVRGGATTILDIGSPANTIDAFAEEVGKLGIRAYLGPGYRSANYTLDARGNIAWEWNPEAGHSGLEQAKAFIRRHHRSQQDRIRGMLYPGQVDTCTPELLQDTKRAAAELDVGIQLHTAMNLVEFHSVVRERGQTPVQYLNELGFLGPEVGLGHCVFHNNHSWAHYPYGDDLATIAASGASVIHAPYKYAKMGLALESFDRYRKAGINVCLGTDTYPQDLISEMRLAGLAGRIVEGSFLAGKARDVFHAATLAGAKALGRDDLGRLAPGAKADIIVVNLRQMQFGGVRDPIKSLVDCGSQRDVETIIVDGQTLLEAGEPTRIDEQKLLAEIQESAERFWASVPEWRAHGETVDDIAPMSAPIRPRPADLVDRS